MHDIDTFLCPLTVARRTLSSRHVCAQALPFQIATPESHMTRGPPPPSIAPPPLNTLLVPLSPIPRPLRACARPTSQSQTQGLPPCPNPFFARP